MAGKKQNPLLRDAKKLVKLLLWEASGGVITLPKSVPPDYKPPAIPFNDRRAMLDATAKLMMADIKVNPENDQSEFEKLKGELNDDSGEGEDDDTDGNDWTGGSSNKAPINKIG